MIYLLYPTAVKNNKKKRKRRLFGGAHRRVWLVRSDLSEYWTHPGGGVTGKPISLLPWTWPRFTSSIRNAETAAEEGLHCPLSEESHGACESWIPGDRPSNRCRSGYAWAAVVYCGPGKKYANMPSLFSPFLAFSWAAYSLKPSKARQQGHRRQEPDSRDLELWKADKMKTTALQLAHFKRLSQEILLQTPQTHLENTLLGGGNGMQGSSLQPEVDRKVEVM